MTRSFSSLRRRRIPRARRLALLLAIFFFVCAVPLAAAAGGDAVAFGDLNGDGRIGAADARLALRHAARLELLAWREMRLADMNADNAVSSADARIVLRIAARLDAAENYVPLPYYYSEEELIRKQVHTAAKEFSYDVFSTTRSGSSYGTGFAVNADGWILTNFHVIEDAEQILLTRYADGERSEAVRVIAYDRDLDLAIVKIDAPTVPAPLRKDLPQTDDKVFSLGSPKKLTDTMSEGYVTCPDRKLGWYREPLIQIDAIVNNGDSGGPLMNTCGEVVGVCAFGLNGADRLNFAIPIRCMDLLDVSSPMSMLEFYVLSTNETKADRAPSH